MLSDPEEIEISLCEEIPHSAHSCQGRIYEHGDRLFIHPQDKETSFEAQFHATVEEAHPHFG